MSGSNYAHCDLDPCLKPTGSTKVFYDADTDIPAGTVIRHPECDAAVLAAAEERGFQRAVDLLRDDVRYHGHQTATGVYIGGRGFLADYLKANRDG